MIHLLLVGATPAADLDHDVAIFPDQRAPRDIDEGPRPARYDGAFTGPPVPEWTVRLPGPRQNAPTQTERSRPVVLGDRVFVGSASAPGVAVITRRSGEQVATLPSRAPVASAVVPVGDQVLYADLAGVVTRAALDGTTTWTRDLGSAIVAPPRIEGDTAYVTTVSDLVVALDVATGALRWKFQPKPDVTRATDLALYARPAPALAGGTLIAGMSDGAIVALDAARGDVAWELQVGEGRFPDVVAPPVVVGSDVFASGYYGPFVAVDLRTHTARWSVPIGSAAAPAVWTAADGATWLLHPGTDGVLRAIDALTGDTRWEWASLTDGALTTPVPTDAGLVVASSAGGLWLVDPATGAETWRYHEPRALTGIAVEPTVAGRQLLFVTEAGRLHALVDPRRPDQGQSPRVPGVPRSPIP